VKLTKLLNNYSLAIILLIVSFFAISFGYAAIPEIFSTLLNPDQASASYVILTEIRIPRILLAVLVGSALGLAGLLAQGAFGNPIAEPAIIGCASGAALGSIVAISLGLINPIFVFLIAALGAVALAVLTFQLALGAKEFGSNLILIIGIAISAIGIALVGIIGTIAGGNGTRSISFWYFGSLSLASFDYVYIALFAIGTGLAVIFGLGRKLDLLSFGDLQTKHWGYKPKAIRFRAILAMSILTAAAVSAVGNIAFLGLAAPHIARSIFGYRHTVLFLPSMLIGAIILLVADTLARNLAGAIELPIGFFTAIIGAPVLIVLARKSALRTNNA
jgi:iron complex transport system permease protein